MNSYLFEKATIVGIGLIGSSLARVFKNKNLAKDVSCFDKNQDFLKRAKELKIVDNAYEELKPAIRAADIVIFCTPVGTYSSLAKEICPLMKKDAILTDVGSVKQKAIEDISPFVTKHINFIPAHPVAGTEKSGPNAGFAELFDGRWGIITPLSDSKKEAIEKVKKMWESAGMKVELMAAPHHDKVMAIVSHVPHLIAYSIVGTADDMESQIKKEIIKYSAGGFRDFTRIAGSDPTMWRDVFLTNSQAVLEVLQQVTEDITALQRAIRWKEADKLEDLFKRTRKIRHEVIGAGQHQPENMKTISKKQEN